MKIPTWLYRVLSSKKTINRDNTKHSQCIIRTKGTIESFSHNYKFVTHFCHVSEQFVVYRMNGLSATNILISARCSYMVYNLWYNNFTFTKLQSIEVNDFAGIHLAWGTTGWITAFGFPRMDRFYKLRECFDPVHQILRLMVAIGDIS